MRYTQISTRGFAVGLRDEKKQEMRRRIVDTAVGLFRLDGFGHTRVADIVERLRISEATFFNYFPTKDAVLEALAVELHDRAHDSLRRKLADDTRPVPERLSELARSLALNFSGDRELVALLARHTRFFASDRDDRRESLLLLTDLLLEGQYRGEIRDDVPADQLAELFQAAALSAVCSWVKDPDENLSLEQRLLPAWEVLAAGCAVASQARGAVSRTKRLAMT
jgi:AcrR family transcriptional regulator